MNMLFSLGMRAWISVSLERHTKLLGKVLADAIDLCGVFHCCVPWWHK